MIRPKVFLFSRTLSAQCFKNKRYQCLKNSGVDRVRFYYKYSIVLILLKFLQLKAWINEYVCIF